MNVYNNVILTKEEHDIILPAVSLHVSLQYMVTTFKRYDSQPVIFLTEFLRHSW